LIRTLLVRPLLTLFAAVLSFLLWKPARRALGAGLASLAVLLTASALFPQLTADIVAHATPSLSIAYNWFAAACMGDATGGVALLATAPAIASERNLQTILGEMSAIVAKHRGKPMPEDDAAKFDSLATEAKPMQDEVVRQKQMSGVRDSVSELKLVRDATLPADTSAAGGETIEQKKEREKREQKKVVGYMRLGDYVTMSDGFRQFHKAAKPNEQRVLVRGGNMRLFDRKSSIVSLTGEQVAILRAIEGKSIDGLELKAVPTIDDTVIEPQRLTDIVRVLEQDRLSLRDVLDVQRTTSNAIEYVRLTNYTRAAGPVAHGALKPQAAVALDSIAEVVRTIAVWLPVNNQQLDDLPALAGIINGELLFDVRKAVEELVMYGDGTGQEFAGIIPNESVLPIGEMPDGSNRIVTGGDSPDTLIDIARRGVTDVRNAGYEPNAILVDPLDWEDIVLEKGSDNRYVWVVVTENGVQRLWGIPVIETMAMQDFAGDAIERRHLLVGDFRRGATLYDRMDAAISTGYINDQFVKNQKTILAELRAAFALKRPGAFRKHLTQEAVAS
jgi:HK97 family phage major capsid protein